MASRTVVTSWRWPEIARKRVIGRGGVENENVALLTASAGLERSPGSTMKKWMRSRSPPAHRAATSPAISP